MGTRRYAEGDHREAGHHRQALSARISDLFSVKFVVSIPKPDELYAGKLVAALERQHPHDLFDL